MTFVIYNEIVNNNNKISIGSGSRIILEKKFESPVTKGFSKTSSVSFSLWLATRPGGIVFQFASLIVLLVTTETKRIFNFIARPS